MSFKNKQIYILVETQPLGEDKIIGAYWSYHKAKSNSNPLLDNRKIKEVEIMDEKEINPLIHPFDKNFNKLPKLSEDKIRIDFNKFPPNPNSPNPFDYYSNDKFF